MGCILILEKDFGENDISSLAGGWALRNLATVFSSLLTYSGGPVFLATLHTESSIGDTDMCSRRLHTEQAMKSDWSFLQKTVTPTAI